MKKVAKVLAKILVLTFAYLIFFALISALLIPPISTNNSSNEGSKLLGALLIVSFVNTLVLSFVIIRSQVAGWRLVGYLFVVFFGIATVMSQMETAIFVSGLPPGMLPRIILSGFFIALIFSAVAVLVWRKNKNKVALGRSGLSLSPKQWLFRLTVIGCSYVIIYFAFGYYLAWKNPAVLAYYGGTDPGDFFSQIKSVFLATPWLPAFQFARGVLWTLIAVIIIYIMKREWWEIGLGVSLSFAILMSSHLLIPNPLMPDAVRQAHFVETISSNFLFGWLITFVLVKWRGLKADTDQSKTTLA